MSQTLYRHHFRHVLEGDHFAEWHLTSLERVWSGKWLKCTGCGKPGNWWQKTTEEHFNNQPAPTRLEFLNQEERIRIVARMRQYTADIRMALSHIIYIKQNYPDFIKENYNELPKYSMQELGDWIQAAEQADDHLVDWAVLFGRPEDPALGKEVKNEPRSS